MPRELTEEVQAALYNSRNRIAYAVEVEWRKFGLWRTSSEIAPTNASSLRVSYGRYDETQGFSRAADVGLLDLEESRRPSVAHFPAGAAFSSEAPFDLEDEDYAENIGYVYEGRIVVPHEGDWDFRLASAGPASLEIDGEEIIDSSIVPGSQPLVTEDGDRIVTEFLESIQWTELDRVDPVPPPTGGVDNDAVRMDYQVRVFAAGLYYVHFRGRRGVTTGNAASTIRFQVTAGGSSAMETVDGFEATYSWSNTLQGGGPATVVLPPGPSTISVYAGDTNFLLDRILITRNSSYAPTGQGPATSVLSGVGFAPSFADPDQLVAIDANLYDTFASDPANGYAFEAIEDLDAASSTVMRFVRHAYEGSGGKTLEAGEHTFRIRYLSVRGGAGLQWYWELPGQQVEQLVPASAYFVTTRPDLLAGPIVFAESAALRAEPATFRMGGDFPFEFDPLDPGEYLGAVCRIFVLFPREDGTVTSDGEALLFDGRISRVNYLQTGEQSTYDITVESRIADLSRAKTSRYTDAEQRTRFGDDDGMLFAEVAVKRIFDTRGTEFTRPPSRRLLYGTTVVETIPVFAGIAGAGNQYLHYIGALADNEISELLRVYMDDSIAREYTAGWPADNFEAVPTDSFEPWVAEKTVFLPLFGTEDQAISQFELRDGYAFTALRSGNDGSGPLGLPAFEGISSENLPLPSRMRGVAALYAMLIKDVNLFGDTFPKISAVVRGKPLREPSTSTVAYSANPALVVRDYLLDAKNGFAAQQTEISRDSFTDAATVCDQLVLSRSEGFIRRYEYHRSVDTERPMGEIIREMVQAMAGRLVYASGKFYVDAGEFTHPVRTLREADVIGEITTEGLDYRSAFNAAKGTFVHAANDYVSTDYPQYADASLRALDGQERALVLDQPWQTSPSRAQRLGKIAVGRSRSERRIRIPVTIEHLELRVGDRIQLDVRQGLLADRVYLIERIEFRLDLLPSMTLVAVEDDASTYEWNPTIDETPMRVPPKIDNRVLSWLLQRLASPQISAVGEGGTNFVGTTTVRLNTGVDAATVRVYYTLDGTDPTEDDESVADGGEIIIPADIESTARRIILRARNIDSIGNQDSEIVAEAFVRQTVPVPTVEPPSSRFDAAQVVTVRSNWDANTYVTTDGSDPRTSDARVLVADGSQIIMTEPRTLRLVNEDQSDGSPVKGTPSDVSVFSYSQRDIPAPEIDPAQTFFDNSTTAVIRARYDDGEHFVTTNGTDPADASSGDRTQVNDGQTVAINGTLVLKAQTFDTSAPSSFSGLDAKTGQTVSGQDFRGQPGLVSSIQFVEENDPPPSPPPSPTPPSDPPPDDSPPPGGGGESGGGGTSRRTDGPTPRWYYRRLSNYWELRIARRDNGALYISTNNRASYRGPYAAIQTWHTDALLSVAAGLWARSAFSVWTKFNIELPPPRATAFGAYSSMDGSNIYMAAIKNGQKIRDFTLVATNVRDRRFVSGLDAFGLSSSQVDTMWAYATKSGWSQSRIDRNDGTTYFTLSI